MAIQDKNPPTNDFTDQQLDRLLKAGVTNTRTTVYRQAKVLRRVQRQATIHDIFSLFWGWLWVLGVGFIAPMFARRSNLSKK